MARSGKEWVSQNPKAPTGVAFAVLYNNDFLVDDENKYVIFRDEQVAKEFVEKEFAPQTDEIGKQFEAVIKARGVSTAASVVVMGEHKWKLFQAEMGGKYREYADVASAGDAMERAAEKVIKALLMA